MSQTCQVDIAYCNRAIIPSRHLWYQTLEQLLQFIQHNLLLVALWLLSGISLLWIQRQLGGARISSLELAPLLYQQACLVDLRAAREFQKSHIAGSFNLPASKLETSLTELEKYRDRPLILVCQMGQQSAAVGRKLKRAGFQDVRILARGIMGWQDENLPLSS